ncbi:PREDICTED: G-type lectin S-receptor-like serine/threonine-protein kinase At5g24080 isoform X2 [Tarenaya hassleriana]|uniref:G-type lectin S-receptor-like serine/threonine-protein kinase At5g24080 isoform X2 n=1 Tax=Tarenaya hassleriana TaxID=28532 RepID=UPI00053C2D5E|nr:PREDICTED: G-type lectin S-receptor-like serine/threonine-protein kinase At5g24080 isoform X2 [Tarenaya hassleriana]
MGFSKWYFRIRIYPVRPNRPVYTRYLVRPTSRRSNHRLVSKQSITTFIIKNPNNLKYRDHPVTKGANLELDITGNLVLSDQTTVFWSSNTSNRGVESAVMSESGNLFLLVGSTATTTSPRPPIWQSFSHPSDTLLPNQPLTVSLELTSPTRNGHYSLKMLQQHTSLTLGLTYSINNPRANYSYWSGPEISNVTGDVTAVLDDSGSFMILYGESSAGAVYVYKNETEDNRGYNNDNNNNTDNLRFSGKPVLRRLVLESNGNLRLYRWDNDVNGSRQWVAEWAAVSNPCNVAGICGYGVCSLDRSKKNADCLCLPGSVKLPSQEDGNVCSDNSSLVQECQNSDRNGTFKISTVQETNYYFSERSVVANYSDMDNASRCGEMCLMDCKCLASVYGLDDEKPYCWILKSLDFGGFKDPGSTLFVRTRANGSKSYNNHPKSDGNDEVKEKVLVIPIVVGMVVLVGLLGCLLYYNLDKKKKMKRSMNPLILSDSPVNFTYRDLQIFTDSFSQLLGAGGFGSVYKGSLAGGTLVAVKKLERVLSHGEREFVTEVNTIGSMHHMNLVRLCGYCSEGSHRLLVYEFMKNGSLDKWIFPTGTSRTRLLDWQTRFSIAVATAQGIAYFHEQCRNRIIHCDIKPENILLDDNFCPKISDFGLAKLMGREQNSHVVTMVRGTRGYLAPEWVSNRPITVKADVYSYGMLLLEIVGGRRNLDMSFDSEDFFFPGLAFKEMSKGTAMEAADRRLKGAADEEEVTKALKVAFWCIQDEVGMRPSMGEVVKLLEGSADDINAPPMPQTVIELIEEGLENVYRAMKREFNHHLMSSFTVNTTTTSASSLSHATCSHSSMSPR